MLGVSVRPSELPNFKFSMSLSVFGANGVLETCYQQFNSLTPRRNIGSCFLHILTLIGSFHVIVFYSNLDVFGLTLFTPEIGLILTCYLLSRMCVASSCTVKDSLRSYSANWVLNAIDVKKNHR